jgi:hypothetical protein
VFRVLKQEGRMSLAVRSAIRERRLRAVGVIRMGFTETGKIVRAFKSFKGTRVVSTAISCTPNSVSQSTNQPFSLVLSLACTVLKFRRRTDYETQIGFQMTSLNLTRQLMAG